MADIRNVALSLYRMINSEPVDEALLREAEEYSATAESPVSADTFRKMFLSVAEHLSDHQGLGPLAARWNKILGKRQQFSEEEALLFYREYIEALDKDRMITEAVTVGFARRSAGSVYDYELSQPRKVTGWSLLYTTEGSALLRSGLREHRVVPHEAILFSPNAVYSMQREERAARWSHYWIVFQPLSTWRPHLEWPEIAPHTGHLMVKHEQSTEINKTLETLLNAFSSNSPLRQELTYNLLEQLVIRCAELVCALPKRTTDERVEHIQNYINVHFAERFSLEELAATFHLSPSRLSALFKNETGMTLFAWRDEKRMIRAAQLLRGTNQSIADISEAIGVDDPAYFSRMFKRLVGSSPRDYRKARPEP